MIPIESTTYQDYPALAPLLHMGKFPSTLSARGNIELLHTPHIRVCIVGARKHSAYTNDIMRLLQSALAGTPVCIISGLALGTDARAHELALALSLPTIAVPGSGLMDHVLYPRTNRMLAQKILDNGGLLVSPFTPETRAAPYTFPARNAIMAHMVDKIIICECEEKSGTMITARIGAEAGVDVGVFPGSILSPLSAGPHALLADGATPLYDVASIRAFLGLSDEDTSEHTPFTTHDPIKDHILALLHHPCTKDEILVESGLDAASLASHITELELMGLIIEEFGIMKRVK